MHNMDNNEIAKKFDLLAKIMELHDDNFFKIKSYTQAYSVLRKIEEPFASMTKTELEKIPGVGGAIADKIIELLQTGEMKTLKQYVDKTPPGIVEMLNIRGLGPKKIKQIWKELDIETTGELLYACNENRIANLKGFGAKTQDELIQLLQYSESNKGKILFAKASKQGEELLQLIKSSYPEAKTAIVGELSLQLPIVKGIELITTILKENFEENLSGVTKEMDNWYYQDIPVYVSHTTDDQYIYEKFRLSCSPDFFGNISFPNKNFTDEMEIFSAVNLPWIHKARRDNLEFQRPDIKAFSPVEVEDLRGLIHFHTTYSDGLNTLEEMKSFAEKVGFEYMLVTDHSQSAFYANGLKEERLKQQWQEVDILNKAAGPYLFKGIESDILIDGDLDYEAEILNHFDCIIASIHSVLKMDEEKATRRLLKAIENPSTKILGHPTGRLLLSRPGYPVNMAKIFDACQANGVAIELNANPRRLDIDYTFLHEISKREILISINPDAHSKEAIRHVEFGVKVAQKANLNPEQIINIWPLRQMKQWLEKQ